jgi:hypothetical protein
MDSFWGALNCCNPGNSSGLSDRPSVDNDVMTNRAGVLSQLSFPPSQTHNWCWSHSLLLSPWPHAVSTTCSVGGSASWRSNERHVLEGGTRGALVPSLSTARVRTHQLPVST